MSTARRGGVDNVVLLSGGAGDPEILAGTVDPSAAGGVAAPEGSFFMRNVAGAGAQYVKTGAAATAWELIKYPPSRVIQVDAAGSVTTIAAGLAAAAALVPPPSPTVQAIVVVAPGVYVEAPLSVPPGVVLVSQAPSQFSVTIVASVPTSPLVTVFPGSELRGFIVSGADGVGGEGVRAATPGGPAVVREVIVSDCTTGYRVTAGAEVNAAFLTALRSAPADAGTTAYLVDAGGMLECSTLLARGSAGAPFADGILVTGVGSRGRIGTVQSNDNTDGLHVDDGAQLDVASGALSRNVVAMHVGATGTGGHLHTFALFVEGSIGFDAVTDGANTVWNDAGSTVDGSKLSLAPGMTISVASLSEDAVTGSLAQLVIAELHVGTEQFPRESAFGEGDSHVRGLAAFLSTVLDAGPFTDVTTILKSPSGSTTPVFPTGALSNAFFVGGDRAFAGFKVETTTAIALGAGALVVEVSDGVGGWIPIRVCVCDTSSPFLSHAEDSFGRVAFEYIRFGDVTGWAAQIINGTTKFWARISVVGGALTTNPIIERVKLGTSATEINEGGELEHSGAAEPIKSLGWHSRRIVDLAGSASGNNGISISANITANLTNNQFNNGVIDGVAGIVRIPEGLDTSLPLTLSFTWLPKGTGGNVEFEARHSQVSIGDVLDGTAADVLQTAIVVAPGINVLTRQTFDFDISSLVPGDFLGFSLFRDATGGNLDDTLAASINLVTVDFEGTLWR